MNSKRLPAMGDCTGLADRFNLFQPNRRPLDCVIVRP
jgi:hypothetical protein